MSQNVAECRTISPSTRKPLQFTSGESHDLGRFPAVFAHFRPFPPHPAVACASPAVTPVSPAVIPVPRLPSFSCPDTGIHAPSRRVGGTHERARPVRRRARARGCPNPAIFPAATAAVRASALPYAVPATLAVAVLIDVPARTISRPPRWSPPRIASRARGSSCTPTAARQFSSWTGAAAALPALEAGSASLCRGP